MSDHRGCSTDSETENGVSLPTKELEDTAVDAIKGCQEDIDTTTDGVPQKAVVNVLQNEYNIRKITTKQAIMDA